MIQQTKKISLVLIMIFALAAGFSQCKIASAEANISQYKSLAPITTPGLAAPTDLASYLQNLFLIGIGIAGAMAVFMIVLGGVQYMSTDAIGKKTDGKTRITNALEGLALVLLCWIIMYTINPNLVGVDFSPSVTPSDQINTNNTNNPTNKINKCTLTVYFRPVLGRSSFTYKDDDGGETEAICNSKKKVWENQHYTSDGTGKLGNVGCYQNTSTRKWCIDLYAGDPNDSRFVATDCSAGSNYNTCEAKKVMWENTYKAFSAPSCQCSYR